MRVLVVHASHYGATREIAERIATVLREEDVDAVPRPASADFDGLNRDEFDGFVVGSAIHAGHWLRPAADFIRQNARVISTRPAWLFSSGPIGPKAAEIDEPAPREIEEFRHLLDVRDHAMFGGSFDPAKAELDDVNWFERQIARRFFPVGDYRDWSEIEQWAREVARQLTGVPVA